MIYYLIKYDTPYGDYDIVRYNHKDFYERLNFYCVSVEAAFNHLKRNDFTRIYFEQDETFNDKLKTFDIIQEFHYPYAYEEFAEKYFPEFLI